MSGFDGLAGLGTQALSQRLSGGVFGGTLRARANLAAGDARIDRTLDTSLAELFGERKDRVDYQADASALFVGQIFGALSGAVGSFFAAQSAKDDAKSQAIDQDHAGKMSDINARIAQADAAAILEAGREEADLASLEYAQASATERTQQATSGFVGGQGSGAEVLASIELAKRIELRTINKNTVRAATQRRLQGIDESNRGTAARASAQNLRRAAGAIQPGAAAATSLLNSGSSLVGRYAALRSGRFA